MTFVLSREQAFELAWSKPMRDIAPMIGVSDVALAKSLRQGGIPLPPRGYWNKLAAGHKVTRPSLAPPDLGTPCAVWISGDLATARTLLVEPDDHRSNDEDIEILTDRFRKRIGMIFLVRVEHSEVTRVKAVAARRNAKAAEGPFAKYDRPRLVGAKEERRLKLMNGLLVAADRYGQGGHLRSVDEGIETTLRFGGHGVTIHVEYDRNDRLCIRIGGRPDRGSRVWSDSSGERLEVLLTEIVVAVARISVLSWREGRDYSLALERRLNAEREQARLAADEQAKRDRIARREAQAAQRVVDLLRAADDMRRAELIVKFVAAVEEKDVDQRFGEWAKWALEQAQTLNPFTGGYFEKAMSEIEQANEDGNAVDGSV